MTKEYEVTFKVKLAKPFQHNYNHWESGELDCIRIPASAQIKEVREPVSVGGYFFTFDELRMYFKSNFGWFVVDMKTAHSAPVTPPEYSDNELEEDFYSYWEQVHAKD